MKVYELTYIISTQLSVEQAGEAAKEVESAIQTRGGVILKSEKIAPRTLSYPIKKQSSGYIGLIEFQIEENSVKEVKAVLDKDIRILRHLMLIKKPMKAMKERRMRKPLFKEGPMPIHKEKVAESAVSQADLDKKLEEILGE